MDVILSNSQDRPSWLQSLQPRPAPALVRSGTKTCLNWRIDGASGIAREPGGERLRRRLLAPFARRGAKPLLEDPAEMGEVVKAPRERDVADVPRGVGGIRQIAPASLQALGLDVAAERGLLVGHQIAGIARRDANGRGNPGHRQLAVAQLLQADA